MERLLSILSLYAGVQADDNLETPKKIYLCPPAAVVAQAQSAARYQPGALSFIYAGIIFTFKGENMPYLATKLRWAEGKILKDGFELLCIYTLGSDNAYITFSGRISLAAYPAANQCKMDNLNTAPQEFSLPKLLSCENDPHNCAVVCPPLQPASLVDQAGKFVQSHQSALGSSAELRKRLPSDLHQRAGIQSAGIQ
ncbi:hypothetical protein [Candidatus Odyssella thessalonicensis]|uniref:hypothetical protein n=1 Tax=Candidatus Odyssella thessalonicensis TaxID=84647 RepID=UPI0011123524|nr:hypothetical protein [Candidatus Odyssella thessalonicensis]